MGFIKNWHLRLSGGLEINIAVKYYYSCYIGSADRRGHGPTDRWKRADG